MIRDRGCCISRLLPFSKRLLRASIFRAAVHLTLSRHRSIVMRNRATHVIVQLSLAFQVVRFY